jgi:hypothetical protein
MGRAFCVPLPLPQTALHPEKKRKKNHNDVTCICGFEVDYTFVTDSSSALSDSDSFSSRRA